MPSSDIGSAELPDIGVLSYNGVQFSSLYTSKVSGDAVPDAAGRTTKYMSYLISVDGVVTLDDDAGDATTDRIWEALRQKLTACGGILSYSGKGFGNPLVINLPGGTLRDVAWGPVPKIIEFTPLGASRSAFIRWQVTTCIPEILSSNIRNLPVLQFNEETELSYDEAGFSRIKINGTLEVPMTRRPTQADRELVLTVDSFREAYLRRISDGFDLTLFRVTDRTVNISRDKRTMQWSFALEELPYTGPPAGMLMATGSFSVVPEKSSVALGAAGSTVNWICVLRASYTVPNGKPRSLAMAAFASLWHFRMRQSQLANPAFINNDQQVQADNQLEVNYFPLLGMNNVGPLPRPGIAFDSAKQRALVLRFSVDEGLYLDSGQISFSATWRLLCNLDDILKATGVWRYSGIEGRNIWAQSVRAISGPSSWLENRLDPAGDVIVDFGSP